MTDTTDTPAADAGGKQPKSVRVVLLALMIAMMLAMLDNMIIGTAMPTIVGELGGLEHLAWVVTAYTLATAASTPLWGKLGDMYGRKGTFMTSIVIFLVGSALSGMAQNMGELIGIGVAALVGFVFWQTRAAEPILPLHIFRSLNFTLMSVIGFITGFVMFGATLFLPLYQQSVQGASATNSGLLLLPMLGAMLVTSMVAGRVTTNTGKYKVFPIAGSALMIVGLYLLSTMDTGTSRLTSGVFMAVVGLGMGCLMQITMLVAQNSVEMKDMGVASSSTTLFRTLGSSFGVAIMGALFNNRVQDVMSERGGALGSKVTEQSAQLDAKSLEKLPVLIREAYQHAVSAGTHTAFLLGAVVAVVALVAAVFVKEVPLKGAGPKEDGKPDTPAAQPPMVEAV